MRTVLSSAVLAGAMLASGVGIASAAPVPRTHHRAWTAHNGSRRTHPWGPQRGLGHAGTVATITKQVSGQSS